jgi:hypothetical protein
VQNVQKSEGEGIMGEEPEKLIIRVDLDGDIAKEFLYLKKIKGIKNNSELIRLLIAEEYRRSGGKPLL